jgi:hypothetical protein
MLLKTRTFVHSLETENIFSFFSAICRVFICLHILKKLFLQRGFFDILYRGNSFFVPDNSEFEIFGINGDFIRQHFNIYIFLYLTLIILYLFGIGRNLTALGVFICLEIQQRLCHTVLNGGDNLFKFVVLYMVFINSYEYFVIKKSAKIKSGLSNLVSNLAAYSICIHLCLVYFISAIHKIHADVWFNGVANYYILSSERFRGTPYNTSLARSGLFVTLTTYFTILVELFYPVLIWLKKTRILMIIAALVLHIGIYIFMMIYDFQIVFMVIQGFFIPDKIWLTWYTNFRKRIKFRRRHEIQQIQS